VKGQAKKIFSLQDNALGTPTAPVTLTSTYYGAGQWTGTGTPNRGINIIFLATAVTGNQNVLFDTQVSTDGVNWLDANRDQYGVVNSPTQRYIHLQTDYAWWRPVVRFDVTDPGGSSSSSSGSIAQSITLFAGVAASKLG